MKRTIYLVLMLVLASALGVVSSASTVAAAPGTNAVDVMLLNQDPDPAQPGTYVEFRWKVTKEGSGILDTVKFELKPNYPFSLDASETAVKEIKDLGPTGENDYYTLYYKVYVDSEAVAENYDLVLAVTTNSVTTDKKFTVRVDDSRNPELVTGIIKTVPTKLMPDSTDNQVNVELLNLGVDDAELVVATLSIPKGFESTYSYSSIASLGTIAGGSSKMATFYIDVGDAVKEGAYPATLSVKYREEGETAMKTKELPIALEIKNKPMFEVTGVSYDPSVITAGDTVTMKIAVKNVGSKDSESVSLRAFKESSQPFDFDEKSDFIGTLKPGEEGEAVIVFSVDNDAASKEYLMDFEIRSIYNEDVFTQEDVASVNILAKKTGFFSRYWMAILIVLAAVFIVAYLSIKKK